MLTDGPTTAARPSSGCPSRRVTSSCPSPVGPLSFPCRTSGTSCSETTPCCRPPTAVKPHAPHGRAGHPTGDGSALHERHNLLRNLRRLDPADDGRRRYLGAGRGVQPAALRARAGGRHDAVCGRPGPSAALCYGRRCDVGTKTPASPAATSARSAAPTPKPASRDAAGKPGREDDGRWRDVHGRHAARRVGVRGGAGVGDAWPRRRELRQRCQLDDAETPGASSAAA